MFMMRDIIVRELENRGYKVKSCVKNSNGVELEGIQIVIGDICPVFYIDRITKDMEENNKSLHQVIDEMVEVIEGSKLDIDIDRISKPEFVLENVYVGLQRKTTERLVKRDCKFEGIEEYLYVKCSKDGTYKLSASHLTSLGISEEELWRKAMEHTRASAIIQPMASMLGLMGHDAEMGQHLYILTNRDGYRGAACVLDQKIIKVLGKRLGANKFTVIPSSVHEVILVPNNERTGIDMERLEHMIQEINATMVDATEQLGDRPYVLEL